MQRKKMLTLCEKDLKSIKGKINAREIIFNTI